MRVLGIVLPLVGLLWVFQGLGIVGGSFMTGQSRWLSIGLATAAVGAALFARAAPADAVIHRRPEGLAPRADPA